MAIFSTVKTVIADIEAEAAKVGGALQSEASVVEASLGPVFKVFIGQTEVIAKQIGSLALHALVTQAGVIAKQVAADPTLATATGPQKFSAFWDRLMAWGKIEAPAIETLAGPAFRALLEMTISTALTAVVPIIAAAA
jgi:hypothetical protein